MKKVSSEIELLKLQHKAEMAKLLEKDNVRVAAEADAAANDVLQCAMVVLRKSRQQTQQARSARDKAEAKALRLMDDLQKERKKRKNAQTAQKEQSDEATELRGYITSLKKNLAKTRQGKAQASG